MVLCSMQHKVGWEQIIWFVQAILQVLKTGIEFYALSFIYTGLTTQPCGISRVLWKYKEGNGFLSIISPG